MVISHTMSFVDDVCSERWIMQNGSLRREGAIPAALEDPGDAAAQAAREAAVAAASAAKDAKERKRLRRLKELRRKQGEEVSEDSDGWYQDLLKRVNPKTGS
mmetsp:Transcript_55616/g.141005  ORF Transcript_55616/g.141005 Transcript_55616/m.141005 type:complete len:102 (+) Transcript_55616:3-308(+)